MKTQWIVGLIAVLLFGAHRASAQADLSLSLGLDFSGSLPLNYSRLLTLTVSNAGPAMATGVTISSQNPTNVTLYSISAGSVATSPDGLLTIGLGTLPAGQSETFTLRVVPQPQIIASANPVNPVDFLSVPVTNTFTVSANETDPNPANNSASTNFVAQSSFPGSPISNYSLLGVGNSTSNRFNLSFEYNNIQDSAVSYSVRGVDTDIFDASYFFITHYQSGLPGDVVVLAGTNASFSATTAMTNWLGVVRFFSPADPTGALGDAANEVQAFFPFSAINADGFTNFTLFPNVIYVTGTASVTNGFISLAASYGEAAYGVAEELDYYTMDLTASHVPGGLRLNASATPEPVVVGNNLTYSLTVSNAMSRTATGVVISNQFPANVTFVSATGGTVTTNNGVLLINLSSLAPGAFETAQVVMQTAIVAPFTNLFRVFCDQPDPDPNNGFAPVFSIVNGVSTVLSADVSVSDTSGYENAEVTTGDPHTSSLLTYTLTVSNAGPATATGIVISNQYPAATVNFISATGGTVTTNNGVLLVQLASLAAGATHQVVITMQPTIQYLVPNYSVNNVADNLGTDAQFTNVFEVSADEYDPVAGNNRVTIAALVLAALPGTPLAWQDPVGSSVDTFVGAGTESGVQSFQNYLGYTNVVPGDVVILLNTNGPMSDLINPTNWAAVIRCFNPADPTGVLGLPATEELTYWGGNVPNGFAGFSLFPNTVYFNNGSGMVGLTDGFVYATATQFGPLGGINIGQEDIMQYYAYVQPTNADLTLSAVAVPSPVTVGGNLVYSLTVSNGGLWTATDVVISNQLPAGVNFVSATGGATPAGGTLLVNLASLAVGATASAQVVVQPTATGSLTNVFQVSADQVNFAPTNAIATTVTTVNDASAAAELSVSASGSPGSVIVGSNLVYSITVSNAGPATASGIVISNPLPANVHFDFAAGVTAVTATGNTLMLNLDPLAAGANELVQITVQPSAAGGITNTFQVSAIQADDNQSNNTATVSSTAQNQPVNSPPTLAITSPTNGQVGTTLNLQADGATTVGNSGAAITNVWVQLNNGSWYPALPYNYQSGGNQNYVPDFSSWLTPLTLTGGSNTLKAYCVDVNGQISLTNSVTFDYQVTVNGTPPTLAITAPTSGQLETNQVFETLGTTTMGSSGATVANVYYQLNNGAWYPGYPNNYNVSLTNWTSGVLNLVPGTNMVQAYCVDTNGLVSATNSVTFDYVVTAGAVFAGPPGTPASGFQNPGGIDVVVGEGGGIGAQPIGDVAFGPNPYDTLAGDVVWLLNTNNGTATTNWQAVLRFVNPADSTGTNGLAATEYETFFPSNSSPNYFAGFALLPNVIYVPATGTNADGSIMADAIVSGPVGSINSGQEAIILYKASLQPSATADLSLSPVVEGGGSVGGITTYYLTVTNFGPSTATGVVISNRIPANEYYFSASAGTVTTNNGILLVNLGSLAASAGTNVTITVYLTLPGGQVTGELTNVFTVSADQTDPVPANNSATNITSVNLAIPGTGLSVSGDLGTSSTDPGAFWGSGVVFEIGPIQEGYAPVGSVGVVFSPFEEEYTNAIVLTASAGDLILLNDPSGGNDPTNWLAVVRYFNPADPTGAIGLAATYSEAFFATNFGGAGFANFKLFPNTYYVTDHTYTTTNGVTTLVAAIEEFGPAGIFLAGESCFTVLSITPTFTDLSLDARATPASVTDGNDLTYSLSVSNGGALTATDVVISNQIPAGVNFVSATGGAVPTNGILVLKLGSLAAGATGTAIVDVEPTVAGQLTNVFQVSSDLLDPVLSNNTATVVSTVTKATVNSADLSLSAGALPEPVGISSNLVYSLIVSNAGPSAATSVIISNQIPVGVNFVSATGGATPSGGILLVNLGSLAAGATNTAQIIVQPVGADKFTNLFTVFSSVTDPVLTNNSAAVISTVTNSPPPTVDVALSLQAAPNPVNVGSPPQVLTYSLTVTNNSSNTATGVVVSNTLPATVTFIMALPSQGTVTNHAGVVTYFVGSLPNGKVATVAIMVQPTAAGLLTNTAEVFSAQTDSQPANNVVTNITTAISVPITNLVMTVLTPMTLNPQTGLFEQLIEVANGGPSTPSSVLVTVGGLAANATLYNATGTTNGLPYVQSATPLGVGSNVVFLLEYYVPTRVMPTNLSYTVIAGPPFIPPVVNGTVMSISRMTVLPNGNVLVEFTAIPGQVYAIQYSSDMKTWQTAVPVITAPANRVQWIDAGPPQTASSPAGQPERYYRVVRLPAK